MLNGDALVLDIQTEKAFSYGQGFHKAMELESNITKRLPAIFNIPELSVIATEKKLYAELPSGDILSGVIDVVARHDSDDMLILGDYKSGTTYKDMQANVYSYLVKHGYEVNSAGQAKYADKRIWWQEIAGDRDPTHFFFLTLNKKVGKTYNNIIQLSYPKTKEDWASPDATSYTYGLNWIMTIIDDIKENLDIK